MKLAGKIALITGGSRGIGRATALAFAAEGADIAFCHLDDGEKADQTAAEIRALGRRAMHRSVDVADIKATRAFAAEVARDFGPIDILFNNAGMNIRKPFEDYTEAEFDRIISVHLKGMFFMAQAVYPAMVARGQGCIINVASQRGLKGAVNSAVYSAAKAAIMGFTRALAWEATPKGVRVNAIAPGPVVDGSDRDDDAAGPAGVHRCAAGGTVRTAGGNRRHGAVAGRSGWRVLCRRDAVAEWRRRHVLSLKAENIF